MMKHTFAALLVLGSVWQTKAFDNTLQSKAFINQCLSQREQADVKITNRTEPDRAGFIVWYPDYGFQCPATGPSADVCAPRCR